jgi:hypothetical protein
MGLRQQGAGLPDGGLFTADQFPRAGDDTPRAGQLPNRGAIEVKSTRDDVVTTAHSQQVIGYLGRYGLVLVTNYRDFLLVGAGPAGAPRLLERYSLAPSEAEFWRSPPHDLARRHGDQLTEYLSRCLMHAAPLRAPKDVAFLLASYARDARRRVEAHHDLPALATVRAGLEEGLGITFQGDRGEHFFRSTLVQTLFYGVFSAWVLWHNDDPARTDRFTWRLAGSFLHLPVLQSLFAQIGMRNRLAELGLIELLNWTDDALARVERGTFFAAFAETEAVQYFYEPFLEAFDPELRRQLGVWYTPREIVWYQVARVDQALRDELGIADGLADPQVYVLDPCCGTGAYLVEVVNTIAATLRARGDDDLLAFDLKRAITDRVFGFELLPAPFVVAHLQIGLLLQRAGIPLSPGERAAVYLTNALTGWEPPGPAQQRLLFPELEQEREAAGRIKREVPILVVLGNPPYNAFAGVSPEEERGLVEPYKEGLISIWGIKKFNLDDLYVRFFRLAERRIAEGTGRGIVSFISNYSWVSEPSFVVLRQRLLQSFNALWIENMHGNRKKSEYAPDGRTSETIFAVDGFSPGIQQGITISLWIKRGEVADQPVIGFRDDLNAARAAERRAQLLASLDDPAFDAHYESAMPVASNRYSFRPMHVAESYLAWPKLEDLCAQPPMYGLMEKRGGALIDIDRESLETRMQMYFDSAVSWDRLRALDTGLTKDAAGYDPQRTRLKVLAAESYQPGNLRRYSFKPFEIRWCYYTGVNPLWNRPRPPLWEQCWPGNAFLLTRPASTSDPEGAPMGWATGLFDDHYLTPDAAAIPMRLVISQRGLSDQTSFLSEPTHPTANLSLQARAYLTNIGITDPDADEYTASLIWWHALAIGFSPAYQKEHEDGFRKDWPRIPLPANADLLSASANLGRSVAALLNADTSIQGVTAGAVAAPLRELARLRRADGRAVQSDAGDLALTAGWGYAGRGDITMPGRGRITERDRTDAEQAAVGDYLALFGAKTLDLWFNDQAYWQNVPMKVWEYTVGGYQVLKKWLSYRERTLLGRDLTPDEARLFTQIARRIAAILLLEPQLDANYRSVIVQTVSL